MRALHLGNFIILILPLTYILIFTLPEIYKVNWQNVSRFYSRSFTYLVGVWYLKASFCLSSHNDIVEDELLFLFSKNTANIWISTVVVLPNGQVLAHPVLLKDAADIINIDCGNASFCYQSIRNSSFVGGWVPLCNVYCDILKERK